MRCSFDAAQFVMYSEKQDLALNIFQASAVDGESALAASLLLIGHVTGSLATKASAMLARSPKSRSKLHVAQPVYYRSPPTHEGGSMPCMLTSLHQGNSTNSQHGPKRCAAQTEMRGER
jgi:hypothetical protein